MKKNLSFRLNYCLKDWVLFLFIELIDINFNIQILIKK